MKRYKIDNNHVVDVPDEVSQQLDIIVIKKDI